jgi:hypothetical protein
MKWFGLFVALFAPLILTGCPYLWDGALFNNTGETIEVSSLGYGAAVLSNQFVRFKGLDRIVRISSGACDYRYAIPEELNSRRFYDFGRMTDRGFQFQLEKDFSINLLPPDYAGTRRPPARCSYSGRDFR